MKTTQRSVRALLITPSFFGYEADIVAELERQGFEVVKIDERPSNSSLARAVIRLSRMILTRAVERYYQDVRHRVAALRFDLVIVVKGEVVPRWFLEELRQNSPNAHWVYYSYDSIEENPNCMGIFDLFDVRYSFDGADIRTDEFALAYLPLFYTSEFAPAARPGGRRTPTWSITFVGTLHTDRYALVDAVCSRDLASYTHLFIQARWYFAVSKYLTGEFRRVPWSSVSTRSMPRREIADVFRDSRAVLDIQRHSQGGLTMRTFEALATGAILVTTNPAVRAEPFYAPERVVIVDRDVANVDVAALHRQLAEMPRPETAAPGFEQYSLANWVRQLTSRATR